MMMAESPFPSPNSSYETLSFLIHAASKTGKTTLGTTAPRPLLILDAEGGSKFITQAGFKSGDYVTKTYWNPHTGPPPRYDGTWDVCVVHIQRWETIVNVYNYLARGEHDFVSLLFDSITEAQRRLKTNIKGTEAMRIQDWGVLLMEMDALIRNMRDLVNMPNTTLRVVMFIAETKQKDGKWRPYLQGQLGDSLPYFMDVVGYLYQEQEQDANGQPTVKITKLLVAQHPQFEAGERVQGALGDVIRNPNITGMMKTIFGEHTITATPPAALVAQSEGK